MVGATSPCTRRKPAFDVVKQSRSPASAPDSQRATEWRTWSSATRDTRAVHGTPRAYLCSSVTGSVANAARLATSLTWKNRSTAIVRAAQESARECVVSCRRYARLSAGRHVRGPSSRSTRDTSVAPSAASCDTGPAMSGWVVACMSAARLLIPRRRVTLADGLTRAHVSQPPPGR